jgi:hypothetical protein
MASYKTLLIPILSEILVKEIGDANIPPIKWKRISPVKYKFITYINDLTEIVSVDFQLIIDNIEKQFYFPPKYRNLDKVYNVGYEISGIEVQFAKTDLKTLLTILSTVVDIVKDFIEKQQPDGVYIRGNAKELGSTDVSKKTNLYKAFIQKQIQTIPEYGVDTYRNGFIIININL